MTSWRFYENNAERLFADYISLDFGSIFKDVGEFIIKSEGNALDVGAGSGRDAAALDSLGFRVIAVEPSDRMRYLASSYHKNNDIVWLNDSLPYLRNVKVMNVSFDLILVSAVWMHLSEKQQFLSLKVLSELLAVGGRIIITLRLGPPEPDRDINVVNTDEVLCMASKVGLETLHVTSVKKDRFNRENITWQKIVLCKAAS
ncbi:class I SAM-dependent methyltransferase [Serratia ureilytica]|uniref:class I SAM-dependent methyltransferase n=1 Tax=Serratia ureilytica TaxID=300181 RepID=UPI0018D5AD5B|nr:class I SAM-dependent methyltransferase [Serratia ureilytica]MBH3318119.1 class I SAM-dependent methyltransferase [Serratia ureilytica]